MSESSAARKVLVVDDEPEVEPMFRQRMRREVRAGLYEFLFARSGRHALEVLDENPDVRLVITDLNMPEMNGWQLLDALGELWPDVPSMVVSAYGDDENKKRAKESGAWGFVAKPVDFTELRGKVAESMEVGGG
ncbi:MAG: response regulator [Chloroflexi bacterium]|nr:response regulator [Chloroflexota bacterium]